MISHGGAMSGYLAHNRVYPDDGAAIVVLTNGDFGSAQTQIADRIANLIFPDAGETAAARALFDQLRAGTDRPEEVHRERLGLFHRPGGGGLRLQPARARRAGELRAQLQGACAAG